MVNLKKIRQKIQCIALIWDNNSAMVYNHALLSISGLQCLNEVRTTKLLVAAGANYYKS